MGLVFIVNDAVQHADLVLRAVYFCSYHDSGRALDHTVR